MLTSIELERFRGFDKHTADFRALTIAVGRNNAGKSTLVEALRLIAAVTDRYTGLTYSEPPKWSDQPRALRGVKPSSKDLGIDLRTVFHEYSDPPARICANFIGGERIELEIGPDQQLFAVLLRANRKPCMSKADAFHLRLPSVAILPQISPLEREERVLTQDYARGTLDTHLASQHFRNHLRLYRPQYDAFRALVQSTWPGIAILSLESDGPHATQDNFITLMVKDGPFAAEVAWMGHGLQMWLQTMWFLARSQHAGTVILDEPDVYMHPDLQRKLVRLVRRRHQQAIITTHSIEILSEVEPEEVLVIDRARRSSRFATQLSAVQSVVERMGGAANLHLTRLSTAA